MRRHSPLRRRDSSQLEDLDWLAKGTAPGERIALGTFETEKFEACELFPEREDEAQLVEIVHDLKNPLATIALEMCVLADRLADDVPEVRNAVTRVALNVAFLDRMVQDLLDSCALEAGRFAIQCRPTEMRTLLEQVIERAVATRDRSRVFLEAPHRVTLLIDDLRIERVVANLVQNALKYAPPTSGIVVRLEVTQNCARVSVLDAGPGLTPEERLYIFERFRRTPHARHRHEGCGLGLYVSKRIVEAHGGRIDVESVANLGSRFYFELPR